LRMTASHPIAEIQTGTLSAIRRKPDPLCRPTPRSPLRPTKYPCQEFGKRWRIP
jgi:hypothetical protein